MDLFIFDLWWMTYNVSLALVAIVFGALMLKNKFIPARIIFGILWLLFIPNTLYLLSDIYHLWNDWYQTTLFFNALLIPLYIILMILGVATFILALKPFEKLLKENKFTKKHRVLIIFLLNFVIAFGVVLGRFQRTNSWEAITNAQKVIHDVSGLITSINLLLYVLLFGIIGNALYFLYKAKKLRFLKI